MNVRLFLGCALLPLMLLSACGESETGDYNGYSKKAEEAQEAAEEAMEHAEDAMHHGEDAMMEAGEEMMDSMEHAGDKMMDSAEDTAESATRYADHMADSAEFELKRAIAGMEELLEEYQSNGVDSSELEAELKAKLEDARAELRKLTNE